MKNSFFGAICLVLTASTSAFAAAGYDCAGTEPFWSLKIRETQLTYTNHERTISGIRITEKRTAEGTSANFLQFTKALTPGGYSVTAIVNANPSCTDGMSDEKYTDQVILQMSGKVFFGCCKQVGQN